MWSCRYCYRPQHPAGRSKVGVNMSLAAGTHERSSSGPGRLRADETGQTSAVGVQAVAVGLVDGTTRIHGDLHAHMLVGQAGQRQRQVRDDIEEVDHPEAAVSIGTSFRPSTAGLRSRHRYFVTPIRSHPHIRWMLGGLRGIAPSRRCRWIIAEFAPSRFIFSAAQMLRTRRRLLEFPADTS